MFFGVKEGDKLVFALSSEIRLSKVTIIFLSSEPKYAPTVLARASTVLRTVHNWHELVRTFYFFFGVIVVYWKNEGRDLFINKKAWFHIKTFCADNS